MGRLKRHPGFDRLCDYVDAGEESPDWRGVRTHLRSCTRCRDEVAWLRQLHEEATKLGPVEPPPGLFEKVLARRAAGERIILQTHGPILPDEAERSWHRPGGSTWPVAVLGSLLAVGVASALLVSTADAGANNLTFEPRRPGPGQQLEVRYVPTTMLAGADSLHLRAHFRAAGQPRGEKHFPGGQLSVTLHADEDGVFHGTLEIPPVAAYGQLAVEDTQGSAVDSNNRRLWEVLTYEGRKPTYEALRQRLIAAEGVDWRRMLEASAQVTRLYPGHPEGWSQRLAVEMQFGDPAKLDSLIAFHRHEFDRIQTNYAGRDVSADAMGALVEYASAIGDRDAQVFWTTSLERVFPDHHILLRLRARALLLDRENVESLFADVETLWAGAKPDFMVALTVFDAAIEATRPDMAEEWGDRLVRLDPEWHFYVGRALSEMEESREAGIRHLYEARESIATASALTRPLRLSTDAWARDRGDRIQAISARLSGALLAAGRADQASAALVEALGQPQPKPDLAVELAGHALSAGDTALAVQFLIQAAADPVSAGVADERGSQLAGLDGMSHRQWRAAVEGARSELAARTMASADYVPLKPDVRVQSMNGQTSLLSDIGSSAPVLVVAAVMPAHVVESRLARFRDLRDRTRSLDLGLAVLVLSADDLRREEIARGADGLNVYFDPDNVAAEMLGVWASIEYLVLDADGVFRGSFFDAEEALRLLRFLPRQALAA